VWQPDFSTKLLALLCLLCLLCLTYLLCLPGLARLLPACTNMAPTGQRLTIALLTVQLVPFAATQTRLSPVVLQLAQ